MNEVELFNLPTFDDTLVVEWVLLDKCQQLPFVSHIEDEKDLVKVASLCYGRRAVGCRTLSAFFILCSLRQKFTSENDFLSVDSSLDFVSVLDC